MADGVCHQILRLQRQRSRRDTEAHPDQSPAQLLALDIAREERDAAYGELTADILEYILSGTEERDRLSPD